jgi:HlyD family secretion protein
VKRKRIMVILLLAAVAGAAALFWGQLHKDDSLQGSGTIEARNIRVGSKVGGRIDQVLVREGDRVHAGQVLVRFDDKEMAAELEQTRATSDKMTRGYRPEEIAEGRAAAAQAKAEYEQRKNGYRQQDIDAAVADLDRAKAEEVRSNADFKRYDALAAKDLVSKQQRDTAEATWKVALAQEQNAQHKLNELKIGYRPEEIASAEAKYQQTQATLDKLEHGNRREDVDLARAAYSFEEARFRERQVMAPTEATVEVLDVRPGDLIAPNTPVATLLEADQIYVRIYIPETQIWRVKVGQKAEVRLDTERNAPIDGVVEQINQQAEFLPRNVQTRDERVHQVIGIKVRINDTSGHVLAGMAADVKLLPAQ